MAHRAGARSLRADSAFVALSKSALLRVSDVENTILVVDENLDVEGTTGAVFTFDCLEQSHLFGAVLGHDDSCWLLPHCAEQVVDIVDVSVFCIQDADALCWSLRHITL